MNFLLGSKKCNFGIYNIAISRMDTGWGAGLGPPRAIGFQQGTLGEPRRYCLSGAALSLSGFEHTTMPEQRVDLRLAATKRDEGFQRRTCAADAQYLATEALAGDFVQHTVFLE